MTSMSLEYNFAHVKYDDTPAPACGKQNRRSLACLLRARTRKELRVPLIFIRVGYQLGGIWAWRGRNTVLRRPDKWQALSRHRPFSFRLPLQGTQRLS